ncbi:MAG: IS1182 family transposase, partial [Bacteroidetes bacterium]
TTGPNDINELKNNLDDLKEQLDIEPKTLEADKGYANTKEIKEIEENSDTECFIPLPVNSKKEEDKKAGIEFTYDKEKDEYQCPQGKALKLKAKSVKQGNKYYNVYQGADCSGCPLKTKCTKSTKGRILKRNVIQDWIDKYKQRMQEEGPKEKVKERKTIVEHPYGTIKWMMGKFHFLLTGKEKAQIEFDLYATAYNLKRLINIDNMALLLQKAENYTWKRV